MCSFFSSFHCILHFVSRKIAITKIDLNILVNAVNIPNKYLQRIYENSRVVSNCIINEMNKLTTENSAITNSIA
jgi:hypothetical protein